MAQANDKNLRPSTQRIPTAGSVMRKDVIVLAPDRSTPDAIDTLVDNRITGAPVVDDRNRVIGFLSEKDCLRQHTPTAMHRTPTAGDVAELMTSPARTVLIETDLVVLAGLFSEHGIRLLPVVDEDERLLGIVSRTDVLAGLREVELPESKYPDYRRPA